MQKPKRGKPEPAVTDAEILLNWRSLNAHVASLDEETARRLITTEKNNGCRKQFVLRLIGRWQLLRNRRERDEIMKEVLSGKEA